MLGTLVNAGAILAGSLAGLLLKKVLRDNIRDIMNQAVGLAVLFVGISSALGSMLQEGANPVLFIVALALGGIVGEALRIEGRLQALGDWLQGRLKVPEGQPSISKGFMAASLVFCVGTMAVLGALESGVRGNHTILYAKSLLDGITCVAMASALGIGVMLSAGSVLVYQGLLTLLAVWVSPFLTADMMREMAIIGGILITGIGLNMLEITRIRVGNLLPALLVPVAWYAVMGLFG